MNAPHHRLAAAIALATATLAAACGGGVRDNPGNCRTDRECAPYACNLRTYTCEGSDGGTGQGDGEIGGDGTKVDVTGGPCARDSQCRAPLAVCDTVRGLCVQCTQASQCGVTAPMCAGNRCVACTGDAHCSGARPICDAATGQCTACMADAQCRAKDGRTPACHAGGQCVQCKSSTECTAPTPACATATSTCVACTEDTHCTGNTPICDKARNACVACGADTQCRTKGAMLPACHMDGRCVQCKGNTDCSGATPVCALAMSKCVACTEDAHCSNAAAPICDNARNQCVPCSSDAQCATKNSSTRGCLTGRCVACTRSEHCSEVTKPVCGGDNTCGPCTSDDQCAMKSNLGPNPGVCMSHQDGRCATDAETWYVENKPGCSMNAASGGGTVTMPFCAPQTAVEALNSNRRLLVVRGPAAVPGLSLIARGPQVSIVGQNAAVIAGGASVGISLVAADLFARDIAVSSSAVDRVGISAQSGATLRLERVRVEDNKGGGILVDGAAFDVRNTRVARNGPGYIMGFGWGGIRIGAPPASGPARLERVTVIGNNAPGLSCAQAVQATGLFAADNPVADVTPACNITACPSPSATCGSDLPP